MNQDAGRGMWLFVTLDLDGGEQLPFVVDTGTTTTCFDKSLEPILGRRLGTGKTWHYGEILKPGVYQAPGLFLAGTRLMTGKNIWSLDLTQLSSLAGRPVRGILGMDCLRHYCVQLDFEAGRLRFLSSNQVTVAQLGRAFPLNIYQNVPFIYHAGLLGESNVSVMMDTGNNHDGDLMSELFLLEARNRALRTEGNPINVKNPGKAWLPQCVWKGATYTNLLIGSGVNSIGLRFLARHLVTFDFPNQTMYLKQLTGLPLVDENAEAAAAFLKSLKDNDRVPGWKKGDDGTIELEAHPDSATYDFRKDNGVSACHYRIKRVSENSPWTLRKAWQTDTNDCLTTEYSLQQ